MAVDDQSEQGHGRYIYTVRGADRLRFRIETSRDGREWSTLMAGDLARVGSAPR